MRVYNICSKGRGRCTPKSPFYSALDLLLLEKTPCRRRSHTFQGDEAGGWNVSAHAEAVHFCSLQPWPMVQMVLLVAHVRWWIAIDSRLSRSGLMVLHVCYRKCAHCLSFAALSVFFSAWGPVGTRCSWQRLETTSSGSQNAWACR